MFRSRKYQISLVLTMLLIGNCFFLSGCQKQELTNAYCNTNINVADTSEDVVSESSVQKLEAFSSQLAVLPENFTNQFSYESNVGEMLLVNDDTNEILYSMNSMKEIAPASTTKILTAYIVLQKCNLNDTVTLQSDIALEDGAVALFIGKGDTITVDELLHGLLIESANDCAVALARHVSGSVDAFAELMNETALSLGATHSHFSNPHGLDEKNHYSCAYDLYLIFKQALTNDHFREIIGTKQYTIQYTDEKGEKVKVPISSTNQYFKGQYAIPEGVTIVGGKTGTTSNAGNCLVLSAENAAGEHLIGVVLCATDRSQLYDTMSHLLCKNQ
ncbi:MAG: serine hydrolase [Lachnospiraceae bacterium]|nr:serine hydrolase [Lachnospiraceae bacterium]